MSRAALKALSRASLTIDELFSTLDALSQLPAQAQVLIGSSLIDDALKQAIIKKLRPNLSETDLGLLFDNEAPLATYSSRINMAYAMEVIGQATRSDLNCMRDMRNAFAHARISLSFDTKPIADACATLTAPKRVIGFAEGGDWPPKTLAQRFRATVKLSWMHITQVGSGGHPILNPP